MAAGGEDSAKCFWVTGKKKCQQCSKTLDRTNTPPPLRVVLLFVGGIVINHCQLNNNKHWQQRHPGGTVLVTWSKQVAHASRAAGETGKVKPNGCQTSRWQTQYRYMVFASDWRVWEQKNVCLRVVQPVEKVKGWQRIKELMRIAHNLAYKYKMLCQSSIGGVITHRKSLEEKVKWISVFCN